MTKHEAWIMAVEAVLNQFANEWVKHVIEKCLKQTDNNIDRAMTVAWEHGYAFHFGNWGRYGRDIDVDCMGSARSTPVSAWIAPRTPYKHRDDPDLVITWKEIFQYVRDGKPEQLGMF